MSQQPAIGLIDFFQEDTDFELAQPMLIRKWLFDVARHYGVAIKELNYIFCSDAYLLQMNIEYLQHDTLTDIITFDNSDPDNQEDNEDDEEEINAENNKKIVHHHELIDINNIKRIEGDIFISVERVAENAQEFGVPFDNELRRVMAHGLLHLIGYQDKTPEQEQQMREQENQCLLLV
jgi:probable rRNA maturation factor